MADVTFVVPAGCGAQLRDSRHYSQAVKIGNRVETSGQGGWNQAFEFPEELQHEIRLAFDNLELVLSEAGACWGDVVAINSYHVGLTEASLQMMTGEFRRRMPSHWPIWTALGVAALGGGLRMHVEVRATAIVGTGK